MAQDRLREARQQLLRYGALMQLLTALQTQTTIEAAAELLARQWKYCADVGDWRFVSMNETAALRIDASDGQSVVQRLPRDELETWERAHAAPADEPHRRLADADLDIEQSRTPPDHPERLILPVRAGGRPLGVFFLGSHGAGFEQTDRKFVELVASLFAGRVDDLQRREAETALLRQQALVDALTRVANRHQFDARLEAEWLQAARARRPLALILLDIDFFKQYNDTYGHPRGDDCLIRVAQLLQAAVRPGDLVARVGGEEFAILLPGLDGSAATTVAQRAQSAIERAGMPHEGSSVARVVTISAGVAARVPPTAASPHGLYEDADRALYAAKRSGRNRVHAG